MPRQHKSLCQRLLKGERAEAFGGEIHLYLWGKAPVKSRGGKRYYVTFLNDKTWITHLYLLQTKDKAPKAYKQF